MGKPVGVGGGGGYPMVPLPLNKSLLVCARKLEECGYKMGLIIDAYLDKLQSYM